MITNATITSIAAPPASSNTGDAVNATPAAVSVRCFFDEPTRAQVISLAERIANASGVAYIPKDASIPAILPRGKMAITIDGSASMLYEVIHVIDRQKAGGLSHWEAFVKDA